MSNVNMIPRYDTKLMTEIWDNAADFVADYKNAGIPNLISDANATTLFYLLYARYGNSPIANYDEEQFKYKVFSVIFQYGPTWEKRLSIQETLRGLQLADLVDDGALHELFEHDGTRSNARTYSESGTNTGTVGVSGTGEDINNHAFNPGTAPAQNAYAPLNYINEQNAKHATNSSTTTNNLADSTTGTVGDNGSDKSDNETTRTLTKGKLAAYEKLLELLKSDVTGEFINKFKICFKQFVMPERTWIYVTEDDEEE